MAGACHAHDRFPLLAIICRCLNAQCSLSVKTFKGSRTPKLRAFAILQLQKPLRCSSALESVEVSVQLLLFSAQLKRRKITLAAYGLKTFSELSDMQSESRKRILNHQILSYSSNVQRLYTDSSA
jgi:hypothetical protein